MSLTDVLKSHLISKFMLITVAQQLFIFYSSNFYIIPLIIHLGEIIHTHYVDKDIVSTLRPVGMI